MQETYNIPLHDIKPLIEIQEYSLVYFIAISVAALIVIAGTIYLLFKWFKRRNKFNIRKEHFKLLNAIDFKNPKKSAYDLTFYGATFKDDSPRHTEMYKNLIQRLEEYKYKKNVEALDKEVLAYIDLYKGMIDV
jgi:hypothetical protein